MPLAAHGLTAVAHLAPILGISRHIATPQFSFRNSLYSIGFQRLHHASFISGNKRPVRFHEKLNIIQMCPLMIKAVATLEPTCSEKESDNAQQLPIDLPATNDQDEKEKLRRKRISKANKGREAWNKGRKHSPETRQKIRERTKIAMRNPEVKLKLLKGIHNQSRETKLRIAAAVRLSWDKRRSNRKLIVRCHHEWRNLIAEASRKGFCGEEELQWDSYEIIGKQLEKEFEEGLEARKKKRSSNPGIRAPKTLEQRKKISEAIAAKWADPAYRDRVYSGIAKKRGIGPETRDPEWGTKNRKKEAKRMRASKKNEGLQGSKMRNPPQAKVKASSKPVYKEPHVRFKDPEARYKLEMIKSIRAQRSASDPKISEAILRANVLIGEAERAAEALEAAAAKSPMAEASLVETRKLIAEAIGYIKSIEKGNIENVESGTSEIEQRGRVNGVRGGVGLKDVEIANGTDHIDISSSSSSWGLEMKEVEADGGRKMASGRGGKGRRWVCGRLVEEELEQ